MKKTFISLMTLGIAGLVGAILLGNPVTLTISDYQELIEVYNNEVAGITITLQKGDSLLDKLDYYILTKNELKGKKIKDKTYTKENYKAKVKELLVKRNSKNQKVIDNLEL